MEQIRKALERIEALRISIEDLPPADERTKAQKIQFYSTIARIDELKDFFGISDPLEDDTTGTAVVEKEIQELEESIFKQRMKLKKKRATYAAYCCQTRKRHKCP